jgi:hypothetical protein
MHHAQDIDAFSEGAVAVFRRQVGALLGGLGVEGTDALLADAQARLRTEALGALPQIAEVLERTGVRERWNSLLARDRAEVLAAWVAPYLRGRVLDLLSGCGAVGRVLAAAGWDVVSTERAAAYRAYLGGEPSHDFAFVDGADPLGSCCADTVLLCTVLHHEVDPEWLLAQATRVQARRLVIVENCLEGDHGEGFHLLMDVFFNHCLNRIDIDIPAQHRTPGEWLRLLGAFGRVRMVEQRPSVPGIPLGHHLFTVDLAPRALGERPAEER